jgi:hypothetical protein
MSPDSSSGSSLKNWILGILGSVLTAVLILVITPYITKKQGQGPAPGSGPKPVTIVSVNGQVFDNAAKRLLENVVVGLHVESLNEEQRTDSLGRYAFSVEGFDPRLSGSIHVQAPGYKPLTYNLSLKEMSDMRDLYLDPAAPAPPTGVAATPDAKAVISHAVPANRYIARIDPKRISALLHH